MFGIAGHDQNIAAFETFRLVYGTHRLGGQRAAVVSATLGNFSETLIGIIELAQPDSVPELTAIIEVYALESRISLPQFTEPFQPSVFLQYRKLLLPAQMPMACSCIDTICSPIVRVTAG